MTKKNVSPFGSIDNKVLYNLSAEFITKRLKDYTNDSKFESGTIDYTICQCSASGLQFADPPVPGSATFYDQLGKYEWYYSSHRWEWDVVASWLSERTSHCHLLDIGCGSGLFIKSVSEVLPHCKFQGIDFSEESVQRGVENGLPLSTTTIDELADQNQSFDVITLFHVLEHVANPVELLEFCKDNLLKENGVILISTPNSPMSVEYGWYDPLNHPPHHLTRWSNASYQYLASRLNAEIFISHSPVKSYFRRVRDSFRAHRNVKHILKIRDILLGALLHPFLLCKIIVLQLRAPSKGDVILVRLKF